MTIEHYSHTTRTIALPETLERRPDLRRYSTYFTTSFPVFGPSTDRYKAFFVLAFFAIASRLRAARMSTIYTHFGLPAEDTMPASIALKAQLLSLVLAAFPTDKRLYPNPFSPQAALEVDSNTACREYYLRLLHEATVWLDENGFVCLDVSADPDDSRYLTWLLHGGEQALFRSWATAEREKQ